MAQEPASSALNPPPTLLRLFLAFARIGLTSFGGGLSGWLLREFVHDRRWMSEEEFLNGLAVAQALPGINVTNMAIWIGYSLKGPLGAASGFLGILMPSTVLIVLLGVLFGTLEDFSIAQVALTGAAAAAVGLPLQLGVSAAIHVRRHVLPIAMVGLTFLAVVWLKVPLIWVVLSLGTVSVASEWIRLRRARI